ncbi:MAG: hypothetical protein ACYTF6_03785 [Planctomycetota bacterium]|jgi:hypothetical protein
MPGYKDMLELIRQGKSPEEIIEALRVEPYRLRRMLGSKRLRGQLELERDLSRKVAAHDVGATIHHLVKRCRQLADDGSGETARKAAEALLAEAKCRLERTPSQELLASLVRRGQLPRSVLFESAEETW